MNSLRERLRMLCFPEILLEAIYLIFLQKQNKAYGIFYSLFHF